MAEENKQTQEQQKKEIELAAKTITEATRIGSNTIHDSIITESFDVNGTQINGTDICDILADYCWNIDKTNSKNKGTTMIPHCYLIEYKQLHNSIITNLINSLSAANNAIEGITDSDKLVGAYGKLQDFANSMIQTAQGQFEQHASEEVKTMTDKVWNASKNGLGQVFDYLGKSFKITNGISESKYLKPYSLLYWLEETKQRYVMPMISNLPTQKLNNSYGENGDSSVFANNSLVKGLGDLASVIPAATRDIVELSNIMTGVKNVGGFSGSFVEKSKFFQYPQETEEYTIQFPLINTVRGNGSTPEWVKNYKFIMLFSLKNMIFRKDNASYYPPLFYDLVIPGVVRQPFCYVSSVEAQPFGMTRLKQCPKIFNFEDSNDSQLIVSVPEMWIVTIKLKSLVATSANMVLSSIFDLPITTKTLN